MQVGTKQVDGITKKPVAAPVYDWEYIEALGVTR